MNILRSICAYIIWAWLAASLLHGAAHLLAGAALTPLPADLTWLGMSVELAFSLGPLLALPLLYSARWLNWGAWLFNTCMLTALLWGYAGHFIFPGKDNITMVSGPAAPAFLISSVLVFIVPMAGLSAGIYLLLQARRQSQEISAEMTNESRAREQRVHAAKRV